MNIDKLKDLIALAECLGQTEATATELSPLIGKYVIVRSRDSGVHSGIFAYGKDRTVRLTESRRLWYWKAAKEHTLSAVSLYGMGEGHKIASEVSQIEILDACEIIPCTPEAEKSIRGCASHDPR